jgi:flagellar protein FlgJ
MFATVATARGAFGGGAGEEQWRPMLVDGFARSAMRAGGIGLAPLVEREMLRAQAAQAEGMGRS